MAWLSGWPGWVDWHRWRDKSLQYEDGYKTNGVKHEERPVSSFGNQSHATISARVANALDNKRSEFCTTSSFIMSAKYTLCKCDALPEKLNQRQATDLDDFQFHFVWFWKRYFLQPLHWHTFCKCVCNFGWIPTWRGAFPAYLWTHAGKAWCQ